MILYIENPKDATKKLLETINKYSKVVGHQIKVQKSTDFLYNNNGTLEKNGKKFLLQLQPKE